MGNQLSPEMRKPACDLVAKAYGHHNTHARFEETQRAWMVAAYFTFTALVFVGLAGRYAEPQFGSLWLGMVAVHLVVSILFMVFREPCVSSWLALVTAVVWLVLASVAQRLYINALEQTGT